MTDVIQKRTHAAVGCGLVVKEVDRIIFIGDLNEVDCWRCLEILREQDRKRKMSKAPKNQHGDPLSICRTCTVGVHTACQAVFEGRMDAVCGCPLCHPADVPESNALEVFYTLVYAVFASQRLDVEETKQRDAEIFHAVRLQYTDAPIEQYVRTLAICEAILAEGAKDYYSRAEVTDALREAGVDIEAAKATPAKTKVPVTRRH